MDPILKNLALCVERGKVDRNAPYPPDMQGKDGADELTKQALDANFSANEILQKALMPGMNKIGDKFGSGEAYIPDLLIAAKAMNAAMVHLQPFFDSGEAKHRGVVIVGTVSGDLHDIGKNIVKMVLKGDGWNVIDLGVNVDAAKYLTAVEGHPGCHVGMSALLTTTMVNMESITSAIKEKYPATNVFVGGAPLSQDFCDKIGADGYFANPHSFTKYLQKL
ncbi:MAG: cobalamin-binding protein [Calditrichaeota bacterium]|nr:MAG: cobalamin-binding protein [Calditrichota bacterium]